jgi:ribonuclease HII
MQRSLVLSPFDIVDNHTEFSDIHALDRTLWDNGVSGFIGVDEAGRGPLAGPVVAASVVLSPGECIQGINDSKKLSRAKRRELFSVIKKQALAVGIGIVDHTRIDKINILNAALEAMAMSVKDLGKYSGLPVLVDGNKAIPDLDNHQKALVDGDAKCASIAAASIVAKETRDGIMVRYHDRYPEYGFDRHKGYATLKHRKAIEEHGYCPLHRKSFKVRIKITQ